MVELAHTAQLDARTRIAARALLDAVFEGELTDHDWEHALGGIHALAWEQDRLVGHGAVVMRRLVHGGSALRAGYESRALAVYTFVRDNILNKWLFDRGSISWYHNVSGRARARPSASRAASLRPRLSAHHT